MGCCSSQKGPLRRESLQGFTFGEVLGAGAYGQVRACRDKKTGGDRAVKIVHLGHKKTMLEKMLVSWGVKGENESDLRHLAVEEEEIWSLATGHKHVLELLACIINDAFAFYVMERCKCSLLDVLEDERASLSFRDLDNYYFQMLSGLEHIHLKGIIHRDIKPANFLVSFEGQIKLCDFGLSCRKDDRQKTRDQAGSPLFMSPEMLCRKNYDCTTDVWSLGVTVYVITFGDFPYIGDGASRDALERCIMGNNPAPPYEPAAGFPDPPVYIVKFLKKLLVHDYRERSSATQCLRLEPVAAFNPVNSERTLKAALKRSMSRLSGESPMTPIFLRSFSTHSAKSTATTGSRVSHRSSESGNSEMSAAMCLVRQRTKQLTPAVPDVFNAEIIQEQINTAVKTATHKRPSQSVPEPAVQPGATLSSSSLTVSVAAGSLTDSAGSTAAVAGSASSVSQTPVLSSLSSGLTVGGVSSKAEDKSSDGMDIYPPAMFVGFPGDHSLSKSCKSMDSMNSMAVAVGARSDQAPSVCSGLDSRHESEFSVDGDLAEIQAEMDKDFSSAKHDFSPPAMFFGTGAGVSKGSVYVNQRAHRGV
jgi:serine/threonine protein kinase